MVPRSTWLGLVGAIALSASTASAQPLRCKPPKQLHEGTCRYADEIGAQPKTTPAPLPPKPRAATPGKTRRPRSSAPRPVPRAPSAKPNPPQPTTSEPAPRPTPPLKPSESTASTVAPSQELEESTHWQPITAAVLGGIAVVGAAVGTGMAVSAKSAYEDSESMCPNHVCTTRSGLDLRDEAFASAQAADIAFALAGVALAGGLVVWLTTPAPHEASKAVAIRLSPQFAGGRLSLEASW